jgi:hypothetical protein
VGYDSVVECLCTMHETQKQAKSKETRGVPQDIDICLASMRP